MSLQLSSQSDHVAVVAAVAAVAGSAVVDVISTGVHVHDELPILESYKHVCQVNTDAQQLT